jgi:16S rRNA (cytidine1402-2'-O)-methyltransferase|tara:strand:+ start:2113 stop:2805 length:693 start_codon:yes stop_codon:yes gene_type:complete
MSDKGHLFVVGTPIGNLEDITLRAISTLQNVDLILAEDTRNSKKLLSAHNIDTKMMSYHEHSNEKETKRIISLLLDGKNLALISDAGTPTISDPGYGLIRDCIKKEIKIIPIPGASAITTAMSVSGLPSDSFTFFGFLPQKKGRIKKIKELLNVDNTIILFESPFRLEKTLNQLKEYLGNRSVVVGRELTKLYEEIIRGNLEDVIKYFSKSKVKGEIVIMIGKDDDRINF